jgi:hypothetical protein
MAAGHGAKVEDGSIHALQYQRAVFHAGRYVHQTALRQEVRLVPEDYLHSCIIPLCFR